MPLSLKTVTGFCVLVLFILEDEDTNKQTPNLRQLMEKDRDEAPEMRAAGSMIWFSAYFDTLGKMQQINENEHWRTLLYGCLYLHVDNNHPA